MGPKTYYYIKTEGLRLHLLERIHSGLYICIGWQKIKLKGPCPLVVNIDIVADCCCTRECCSRKMLKETQTEETIGFLSSFLSLVAFQLGGTGALGPSKHGYGFVITGQICSHTNYKIWHNQTAKEHLPL